MDEKSAIKVSIISIIINVLLSAIKLLAGILASSGAMVSDAVHSLSDVLSTFVVIIGVKVSNRAPDKEHQYGHERMECVASILLAGLLFATGVGIGLSGIQKITSGEPLAMPGQLALVAAVISIVVKEWMFWYTRGVAKRIKSGALMADAWHHRSDALSSVGSFIGIFGARLGLPILDPIASVIICLLICKAAFDIFKDACDRLVDKACPEDVVQQMRSLIAVQDGVLAIDRIQTRMFGSKIYMDVEISADGHLMLEQTHAIAQTVHDTLEKAFPAIKHCMVHVNPWEEEHAAEAAKESASHDDSLPMV